MSSKDVASRVIRILRERYTKKSDMDLGNPKDTLLGVLLSARTKDAQVLSIYSAFRKAFPTFASLAASTPAEIRKYISTIGLYRAKAKAIHELSKIVVSEYGGKVPRTVEELVKLPGIGRKSANCVLSYVYGEDAICVDTHVFRIAHRLGWTKAKTPEKAECDLQEIVPKDQWSDINRTFVFFGRDICKPGKRPECWRCPVARWCAYAPKAEKGIKGKKRSLCS